MKEVYCIVGLHKTKESITRVEWEAKLNINPLRYLEKNTLINKSSILNTVKNCEATVSFLIY